MRNCHPLTALFCAILREDCPVPYFRLAPHTASNRGSGRTGRNVNRGRAVIHRAARPTCGHTRFHPRLSGRTGVIAPAGNALSDERQARQEGADEHLSTFGNQLRRQLPRQPSVYRFQRPTSSQRRGVRRLKFRMDSHRSSNIFPPYSGESIQSHQRQARHLHY